MQLMSTLYRGPSIDASYQVSVHLAKRFQRRILKINKHGHHRQFLFLIGRFLKIFSSEITWPNDRNLVGSIYGRFSVKIGME
jgi:hypothetical protein